ncbi:hypothetical protein [Streptomyces bauhiniae]
MAHRTVAPAAPSGRPPTSFPAELLPHLGLPDLADLTTDQVAGRTCIWGGAALTLAAAIDLGEPIGDDGSRCFLQSCGQCLAERATEGLAAHDLTCDVCIDPRFTDCATGRGLDRLESDASRQAKGGCS